MPNPMQQQQAAPPSPPPAPSTQMGRIFDPRSSAGILSRGRNIYEGGAMLGPPGAGRPRENAAIQTQGGVITPALMSAIQERLRGYTQRAADKSSTGGLNFGGGTSSFSPTGR